MWVDVFCWIDCVWSPHVIYWCDFAYYVNYIVFICHHDDVCENYIGSVYVGGYCGLSKCRLCVFGKLCPAGLLVVCQSCSILL